jgi:hypothetical protein
MAGADYGSRRFSFDHRLGERWRVGVCVYRLAEHLLNALITRSLAAANSIRLPKPKPRAASVQLVVPSIHSREVTRGHRSGVRDVEDALQPLDFGNGLLGVHPSHYLTEMQEGQFEATSRKTFHKSHRDGCCSLCVLKRHV